MHISPRQIKNIFAREVSVYFTTPPAYVFIVIFLLLTGFFTFASSPFGNLLNTNETSLSNSFFMFHPWLFLVLIPAIGMRLWSEEKKSGTVELLFTMPVSILDAVLGKYFAALFITLIALILTFPIVITVNWLGTPDNNIIFCGYIASFLLAASYLALTSLFSAITKNQIISFIVSFVVCLLLALIGHPAVTDFFIEWAPVWMTSLLSNMSIFPHFEMLQKGIIDLRDLLYFASIITFGIVGTCMVLVNRKPLTWFKLFLIWILFLNVNCIVNSIHSLRYDATQDDLYTLNQGTKSIINKLKYPISVRFYCSFKDNRLPVQLRGYADRINDLLREYAVLSKGKIVVERFDPVPDSDYETSAVIDGIQGQMLKNGEKCYFGIAFSCMGKNEVISFLNPAGEKTIEYDITRAIYDVTNFKKPTIGILSSLPVMGGFSGAIPLRSNKKMPWIFVQELQKVFDVDKLDYDTEKINKNVDVLLVVHPKNISLATQFAIDQFILNGGKMIAFLDPYCITDNILARSQYVPVNDPSPTASSLNNLLKAWGLTFSIDDQVVISPQNAFKPTNSMEKEHPAIIEISGKSFLNQDNIVTANLNKLDFVFAGAFDGDVKPGLQKDVLIKTDRYSNIFNGFSINIPSEYIMNNFTSGKKPLDLCLEVSGDFSTAFPDKVKEENSKKQTYLMKSKTPSSVILVGDADMLFNPFCVAKKQVYEQTVIDVINSNLDFVLNAVDQQSGSQDIIKIRTRGTKKRGFVKFDQIFNNAKKKYRKQISVLEKQLTETSKFVKDIQQKQTDNKAIKLNDEQINTIRKHKLEQRDTERKLRELRKRLREELDSLKLRIQLMDIAFPPLLVIIIGIIVSVMRLKSYNKEYESETDEK
jgi:ABC-type uncharacterized transport system involved in gliding motility auxiliary subunit/ABC-type transport system involved in multi-copper enzyme maturation permease subunit